MYVHSDIMYVRVKDGRINFNPLSKQIKTFVTFTGASRKLKQIVPHSHLDYQYSDYTTE